MRGYTRSSKFGFGLNRFNIYIYCNNFDSLCEHTQTTLNHGTIGFVFYLLIESFDCLFCCFLNNRYSSFPFHDRSICVWFRNTKPRKFNQTDTDSLSPNLIFSGTQHLDERKSFMPLTCCIRIDMDISHQAHLGNIIPKRKG